MQKGALEVAESCTATGVLLVSAPAPAVQRVARSLLAVLGLSSQLLDAMGADRPQQHAIAVRDAISRLGAAS